MGYRSIAVSKDTFSADYMEDAADVFIELLPELLKLMEELDGGVTLSVNIPSMPMQSIKGVRAARLALQDYSITYEEKVDENGDPAFFVKSQKLTVCEDMDYDEKCVSEGYVTVTPLKYDITDHAALSAAKKLERDCCSE